MSKERELLRKILRDTQYINYECNDKIRNEIVEYLAQPEQEQEPIAYVAGPSVGFDVSRSAQGMPLLWLGKLEYGDTLYRVKR